MTDRSTAGRPADLVRQIGVISAISFMLIAAVVGVGVLGGTPVQDLQDGALAADGSYLAPGSQAFSIWTVIYVLMVGYAVWQALPSQRADGRQRLLGWWIAATAVLNGLWLVAAQFTTLPLTVLVIVLLLATLGWTYHLAVQRPPRGLRQALLTDLTVGLHLGWVALATVANSSAWLTRIVPADWAEAATAFGIAVIVVVALVGVAIALAGRGRIAPGLAMGWGLVWIGVGRWVDQPASEPIAIAAWIAAGVVVIVPIIVTAVRFASNRS
ncbi:MULTISPECIES: tryptophan-rich sensory protein [unclassified Microbacterium]|uniref:tryptophan-rich sensory protein n=1 Tax=unclassified Microbacterium TaxID=2609290 RepID=UPI00214CFDD4|nr:MULTISPECIES: tryptophan-rich sensory protein [unclassified Microbacterium]MCR2784860.1 tryptophan-rich sensory protein [Microbacterium sp. zg.B96]WIM16398.1 tryptophan-rich sensory protein [Microbacterium sp. zg-B96]